MDYTNSASSTSSKPCRNSPHNEALGPSRDTDYFRTYNWDASPTFKCLSRNSMPQKLEQYGHPYKKPDRKNNHRSIPQEARPIDRSTPTKTFHATPMPPNHVELSQDEAELYELAISPLMIKPSMDDMPQKLDRNIHPYKKPDGMNDDRATFQETTPIDRSIPTKTSYAAPTPPSHVELSPDVAELYELAISPLMIEPQKTNFVPNMNHFKNLDYGSQISKPQEKEEPSPPSAFVPSTRPSIRTQLRAKNGTIIWNPFADNLPNWWLEQKAEKYSHLSIEQAKMMIALCDIQRKAEAAKLAAEKEVLDAHAKPVIPSTRPPIRTQLRTKNGTIIRIPYLDKRPDWWLEIKAKKYPHVTLEREKMLFALFDIQRKAEAANLAAEKGDSDAQMVPYQQEK